MQVYCLTKGRKIKIVIHLNFIKMEIEKLLKTRKERKVLTYKEQDKLDKLVFETAENDWKLIHDQLAAIYNKLKDKFGEETIDLSLLGSTTWHLCDLIEETRDL